MSVQLSFEVQPPHNPAKAPKFWQLIKNLEKLHPTFISITYGVSGKDRTATAEAAKMLAATTAVPAAPHLTVVGSSRAEVVAMIERMLQAQARIFLALRGDTPANTAQRQQSAGELTSACELIQLIRQVDSEMWAPSDVKHQEAPPLAIGVAAFPGGNRRAGTTQTQEVNRLLEKQSAGADFAITQLIFAAESYLSFLTEARAAGVTIPIIPGLFPVVSRDDLLRTAALTGVEVPVAVIDRITSETARGSEYQSGIKGTAELAQELLADGAPGLHFFTFNRHRPVTHVLELLELQN